MSEKEKLEDKDLRLAFFDIVNGYSEVFIEVPNDCSFFSEENKNISCFAKHFNFFDQIKIDKLHAQAFQKAKKKGLPTRKENLNFLHESGDWTKEEEREWAGKKSYISTLEKTKAKMVIPHQAEAIQAQIDREQETVQELESKRSSLVGQTCEAYADNYINAYTICSSLFSDRLLTKNLFSDDEVEYLDNRDLAVLIKGYNTAVELLAIKNIKQMSVSGFFTSYYALAEDNPLSFFDVNGAPELTFYQLNLLSYAKVLRSIIRNLDPPKDIIGDADLLLEWSEKGEEQRKLMERANNKDNSYSVVGASKEDYEKMKVEREGDSIFDLAKEKGGELGLLDFVDD